MRQFSLSASHVKPAPSLSPSIGPPPPHIICLPELLAARASFGVLTAEFGATSHIHGEALTVPRWLNLTRSKRTLGCSTSCASAAAAPLTIMMVNPSGGVP